MKIIYVAGPYMGRDYKEIDQHIIDARDYAIELWQRGWGVFCPHLNTAHFEVLTHGVDESQYKAFDMQMLLACDAVFAIPGWHKSEGATMEIETAKRLGKPCYADLSEVPVEWPEFKP